MENAPTVYQKMDMLDDEAIKAELENRVVTTWVYQFEQDGKPTAGLSKVGVDAACTEMAAQGHLIEEEDLQWEKCPIDSEYVLFKARVRRVLLNPEGRRTPMEPVFGTKRQWIKEKARGNVRDDKFWFEKGSAKALRNARSRLIPEEIRTRIIALAKQKGRVQKVNGDRPESKPSPGMGNTFKDFLNAMALLKETIGPEIYYGILKSAGYEHANKILKRTEQQKVYDELIKALQGLEETTDEPELELPPA